MDPDFLHDLFSGFRPIVIRKMFGGAGLYADGVMFGLIADDAIYLKIGESNEADFIAENMPRFGMEMKGVWREMASYRKMPERLYDEPDELAQWAKRALHAAQHKNKMKTPAKKTPAKKTLAKKKPAARAKAKSRRLTKR